MKTLLLAAVATVAISGTALARSGDGPSNSNGPTNITNQGGRGGDGGRGGTGVGVGVGVGIGGTVENRNFNNAFGGSSYNQGITGTGGNSQGGNSSVNVAAPGDQRITHQGSYTVRNTPDVYAPALAGGANPCVIGASAGGSGAGFGLSFGFTTNDPGCERRNMAIILSGMGQRDAAIEVLCRDSAVREALVAVGRPCAADRPRVASVSVAPVQAAPLPAQAVPVAAPRNPNRPSYCDRVPGIQNSECQ